MPKSLFNVFEVVRANGSDKKEFILARRQVLILLPTLFRK